MSTHTVYDAPTLRALELAQQQGYADFSPLKPKVSLDQTPRQQRFELPAFDDDLTTQQTASIGPHWSEVKPAVPETWGRFLWRKTVFCGVKTLAGR